MTRTGPLLTLLAGGTLAGALLLASMQAADPPGGAPDPALAGGATPGTSPAPTALPEPEPVTYVGYVEDDTASVAIIVTDEEATGYVCDGDTVETWLTGTARAGELRLTGDGGSLTADYDAARATGSTSVGGRDWTFALEAVAAPEGLYRFADTVAGAEVDGGWIVLPDGTQVGVLNVDGEAAAAPALDPSTGRVDVVGEPVTAQRLG